MPASLRRKMKYLWLQKGNLKYYHDQSEAQKKSIFPATISGHPYIYLSNEPHQCMPMHTNITTYVHNIYVFLCITIFSDLFFILFFYMLSRIFATQVEYHYSSPFQFFLFPFSNLYYSFEILIQEI